MVIQFSLISIAKKDSITDFRVIILSRLVISHCSICVVVFADRDALNSDTDSGLGRATPPRRAPSPGMGGSQGVGRHLPSPSGPGSLPPGLITKRRMFDDGSSDISSAQSSMMDYTGEELWTALVIMFQETSREERKW